MTGIVAGNSRESAVGTTLPAVLSLIGGLGIYLIGKNLFQRILVSLSVAALSLSLMLGFFWGAILRVDAENFYYGIARGGVRGNIVGNLDVVPIYVRDFAKSLDFYKTALQFDVKLDELAPTGERWIEVAPKGQSIRFLFIKDTSQPASARRFTGYIFGVDDIVRTYKRLVVNSVQFLEEPEDHKTPVRFVDPDQNVFTVVEEPPTPPVSEAKK